MCAQPGQKHREVERLDQVVVGAGVQTHDHVDLVAASGQHHDEQVWLLGAKHSGHIDAVHVGKSQVQQDNVWGRLACPGQPASAAPAPVRVIAAAQQTGPQVLAARVGRGPVVKLHLLSASGLPEVIALVRVAT